MSDAALVCCLDLPLLLRVRVAHVKVAVEGELIERGEAVRGEDVARGGDVDGHRVEGLRRNVESAVAAMPRLFL